MRAMISFRLINPTEILFGQGQIAHLDELLPKDAKVLLLYGGGSIKQNGVYDQVKKGLGQRAVAEFAGVEPNPVYETLLKAAELARKSGSNFVLGVGGGSVIDAAKFLAVMVPIANEDPWDYLVAGKQPPSILPNGAILTLPATGSESNPVSVISSVTRRLKYPFDNRAARPAIAIMDPSTMASLDRRQLGNGVVDAVTHVLEQYATTSANTPVQMGYSETLLEVLFEWGPRLLEENTPEARENVMWAANQALNGLIGAGVADDWATHYIGHAITALYDVDHARTLSSVMPALFRFKLKDKQTMLARYARRVWKITEPDDAKAAERAVTLTEDFFRRMGLPVTTGELAPVKVSADDVVEHIAALGQMPLGEGKDIGPNEVRAILSLAN
jgi:NADP-dependent alcohol dehydrogenase